MHFFPPISPHLRDSRSDEIAETERGEFGNVRAAWQRRVFIRSNGTLNGVTNIWRLQIYNPDG